MVRSALAFAAASLLAFPLLAAPEVEFRLRPEGSTTLTPANPTLRVVVEARVSRWGEATRVGPVGGSVPISGADSRDQFGWLLAGLRVAATDTPGPGKSLTKAVLTAEQFAPDRFPGDKRLTSNAAWQDDNGEGTRSGWTFAMRSFVGFFGESHAVNGKPMVVDGQMVLSGRDDAYRDMFGFTYAPGAGHQGAHIGLSTNPLGEGRFAPIYVFQYSTSDFTPRGFQLQCKLTRDGSQDAAAALYYATTSNTATGGRVDNAVFFDADPLTVNTIDLAPLTLRVAAAVCVTDLDASGSVGIADLFAFLRAYFAGDGLADWDHAGGVTNQDVFAFLRDWFAGC